MGFRVLHPGHAREIVMVRLDLGSFFGNPGRDAREVAGDERAAILETMEDARYRTRLRSGECRARVVALPKTFPPRNNLC